MDAPTPINWGEQKPQLSHSFSAIQKGAPCWASFQFTHQMLHGRKAAKLKEELQEAAVKANSCESFG